MTTHSNFLPGELHGQRSLVGYNPRGHKELDMTEPSNAFMLLCILLLRETFVQVQAVQQRGPGPICLTVTLMERTTPKMTDEVIMTVMLIMVPGMTMTLLT